MHQTERNCEGEDHRDKSKKAGKGADGAYHAFAAPWAARYVEVGDTAHARQSEGSVGDKRLLCIQNGIIDIIIIHGDRLITLRHS